MEQRGNWKKIIPEEERAELNADILQFDEPSKYGINGGRISKLCITNKKGDWLANYDRGWDVEPTEEIKLIQTRKPRKKLQQNTTLAHCTGNNICGRD